MSYNLILPLSATESQNSSVYPKLFQSATERTFRVMGALVPVN